MAMAFSKSLLVVALLLVLMVVDGQQGPDDLSMTDGGQRSLLEAAKLNCPSACKVRCGRNWESNVCNKTCNIWCLQCSCVPSGTGQDTRKKCPCYANMIDSKTGKPKCP